MAASTSVFAMMAATRAWVACALAAVTSAWTIGLAAAAVVAAASAVVASVAAFSAVAWAVASRVEAAWRAASWAASILSVFLLCVNARRFTRGGGVFVFGWA